MQKTFRERVLAQVRSIPSGSTLSYKEVAILAGSPMAFRAVGNILNKNFDPAIPCHRVVQSNGNVGGYNRGTRKKRELLKGETKRISLPEGVLQAS